MALNVDKIVAPCTLYHVSNKRSWGGQRDYWPVQVIELRNEPLTDGGMRREALISWNNNPRHWVSLDRLKNYRRSPPAPKKARAPLVLP